VNKVSAPIVVFLLFFMNEIYLLVAETNKYYDQYLDMPNSDGQSCVPGATVQEMYIFFSYRNKNGT
jgi:hypothetical protein